jgi:hypothetical protein
MARTKRRTTAAKASLIFDQVELVHRQAGFL